MPDETRPMFHWTTSLIRKPLAIMFHRVHSSIRPIVVVLGLFAWMALAAAGFLVLEAYEKSPGAGNRSPPGWPVGSTPGIVAGLPNVVMAVHPRCPCSRASLEALAEIVRHSPDAASIRLLVFLPAGADQGWAGASCDRAIAEIRGAIHVDDRGGREAARFGLLTSGAVAAFDAGGRLRFSGGLTEARGRSGESAGGEAILALLEGRGPGIGTAPVFGCAPGRTSRR
jgi:hypothetical protein